jgi:hypothetical protein
MFKKLNITTLSLIIGWAIGFWIFHISATIHIMLIVAGITFLVGLLYNKTIMR